MAESIHKQLVQSATPLGQLRCVLYCSGQLVMLIARYTGWVPFYSLSY
jgi:hypothetical protein